MKWHFSKLLIMNFTEGKIEQLLNLKANTRILQNCTGLPMWGQETFSGSFYFMHYEIDILKTCLRNAAGNERKRPGSFGFKDFFDKHSDMDLVQLSQVQKLEDVIHSLKGSVYYEPLQKLLDRGKATLPACETAVDMLYF